jgi:dienelactone hydrolase
MDMPPLYTEQGLSKIVPLVFYAPKLVMGFILSYSSICAMTEGLIMLKSNEFNYDDEGLTCRAFIAHDDSIAQPKPCVLIIHDWRGRSDFFCEKAKQLAMLGYVGFAVDMYGNGTIGDTIEERMALLGPLKNNRILLRQRILSALSTAQMLAEVNPSKIAAIGYCFGGLCALDLARSGAPVNGVVSFHGLLDAPEQATCEQIRAKILVLHGYDDPMVPPSMVNQFAQEMSEKKVDWQLHMYGQTQHAFTNPEANDDQLGLHYHASADHRSWQSTVLFLNEIFGSL